jgi:hypothetical protein
MLIEIGENGKILKDFETYLTDQNGRRWVAQFRLLVMMTNSSMEIHTQQLGVIKGDWQSS